MNKYPTIYNIQPSIEIKDITNGKYMSNIYFRAR